MDVWVEDWKHAQLRAKERGNGDAHIKRAIDLVPGDGFVRNGDEYVVLWWAVSHEDFHWTIRVRNTLDSVDHVHTFPDQELAAWPHSQVNYGRGRCGHCMCHVGRNHKPGSEDCREAAEERRKSESDWRYSDDHS